MKTHNITWEWAHNNYCTYLNSHLLGALCEYVLQLPRSRLKLIPFLASPPEHASCCHVQPSILLFISVGRVSHLTPSCCLGGFSLLTKVQVNNITSLLDTHMCTYVYTSHQHYCSSLLSTHLPFFLAGWLIQVLPVWHNTYFLYGQNPPSPWIPSPIAHLKMPLQLPINWSAQLHTFALIQNVFRECIFRQQGPHFYRQRRPDLPVRFR